MGSEGRATVVPPVAINAGEEHAKVVAPLVCDTVDEGDAIELSGDKLEVEEPKDRGLGAVAKMPAFGATTTVTMPAWAAAVSSMSEPVVECRSTSATGVASVIMACTGCPTQPTDGGDISTL